jgi:AraC family transcriptional regulator
MELHWRSIKSGEHSVVAEEPTQQGSTTVLRLGNGATTLVARGVALVVVVRGSASIRSKEGQFNLARRRWMMLERDSAPLIANRGDAAVWVVAIDARAFEAAGRRFQLMWPDSGSLDRVGLRGIRSALRTLAKMPKAPALWDALTQLSASSDPSGELLLRCPGRTTLRKRQVLQRLQRARLFLEGHAGRIVRITELADLVRVSVWHFTKTFRHVFGVNPQTYATNVRLERARDLARDTTLSIGEIASSCGFENACSFARAFQQRFGISASGLRSRRGNIEAIEPMRRAR